MERLVNLFNKHKCDKGSLRHRYDRVYEPALEHLRDKEFNMLEIGVFKGSSVEAWREYFPKATLYSIDIFVRVTPEHIPALNRSQVRWCKCDSIEGPNAQFKEMVADVEFDVIIDDGLHTHDAQRQTFVNFVPYLSNKGVYFIEDVWAFDHLTVAQKQHQWIKRHPNDYSDKQYNSLLRALKPYQTKFHDCRKGFHTDTFIIEIRRHDI